MKLIKRFILKRPAEKRLAYFYGMVATDEQVWLLRDENGDMLLFEDEDGYPFVLPVWPTRSFAEMMAANLDETFEAFNLPLSIFLDDLIVDIENDSGAISIFPNENDTIIQTRDEIKEMIRILYQAEYFMLNGELYHKRNRIFIELPEQFCPIMSNNN